MNYIVTVSGILRAATGARVERRVGALQLLRSLNRQTALGLVGPILLSLALSAVSGCRGCAPKQHDGVDLSGLWAGDGYTCTEGRVPTEQISIVQNENSIVATKKTGDACIPAGQVTFQGTFSGPKIPQSMPVKTTVLNSGVVGQIDASLTIVDNNSLQLSTPSWTVVLHRQQ